MFRLDVWMYWWAFYNVIRFIFAQKIVWFNFWQILEGLFINNYKLVYDLISVSEFCEWWSKQFSIVNTDRLLLCIN